jgi:hypothetical protein
MKIFIVLHHEIMGTPEDCRVDEMVFYTCDSLEKAISLIRKSGVDRWSWWERFNRKNSTAMIGPYTLGTTDCEAGNLPKLLMRRA